MHVNSLSSEEVMQPLAIRFLRTLGRSKETK